MVHLYQGRWSKGLPTIYRSSLEQVSKIILALRFHGSDAKTSTPFHHIPRVQKEMLQHLICLLRVSNFHQKQTNSMTHFF